MKVAGRQELNQISLTGLRAIVMIGLLIVKPRSMEEIRKALIDYNILDKTSSYDVLRIDLNTIKTMGCEISRSSAKTGYKYILTKHPFCLKFSKEEVLALKKVYNKLKQKSKLKTLIEYDYLFKKIIPHVCDAESYEILSGVSILKYYNMEFLETLILDAQQKNILEIIYKSPLAKNETKKEIIVQDIKVKSDKVYLFGYDTSKKEQVMLNVKRILSVISRRLRKGSIEIKTVNIKFKLENLDTSVLEENEKIVEKISNTTYIVEGAYYSEFLATQRVLSFGADCTVLEPTSFKNEIINKIREMRKTYGS